MNFTQLLHLLGELENHIKLSNPRDKIELLEALSRLETYACLRKTIEAFRNAHSTTRVDAYPVTGTFGVYTS